MSEDIELPLLICNEKAARSPIRSHPYIIHTKHVITMPQTCHNMPQPPQGCINDMQTRTETRDITPEDETTIITSA